MAQYADYLGIDVAAEKNLLWIAHRCMLAPLPQGWQEFTAEDGSFTTPSWTAEELLAAGAEVGVRRAVLISHGGIYGFDNSYMCAPPPPPCLRPSPTTLS